MKSKLSTLLILLMIPISSFGRGPVAHSSDDQAKIPFGDRPAENSLSTEFDITENLDAWVLAGRLSTPASVKANCAEDGAKPEVYDVQMRNYCQKEGDGQIAILGTGISTQFKGFCVKVEGQKFLSTTYKLKSGSSETFDLRVRKHRETIDVLFKRTGGESASSPARYCSLTLEKPKGSEIPSLAMQFRNAAEKYSGDSYFSLERPRPGENLEQMMYRALGYLQCVEAGGWNRTHSYITDRKGYVIKTECENHNSPTSGEALYLSGMKKKIENELYLSETKCEIRGSDGGDGYGRRCFILFHRNGRTTYMGAYMPSVYGLTIGQQCNDYYRRNRFYCADTAKPFDPQTEPYMQ